MNLTKINVNANDFLKENYEDVVEQYLECINKAFENKTFLLSEENGRVKISLKVDEIMPKHIFSAISAEFKEQGFSISAIRVETESKIVFSDEKSSIQEIVEEEKEESHDLQDDIEGFDSEDDKVYTQRDFQIFDLVVM